MPLLIKTVLRLLSLPLAFLLAIGAFSVVKNQGWLSPFGIESETRDSQVIQAIERTQEVSLLSLAIQGIKEQHQSREIFGKSIPGTGESAFIRYNFRAKLGIDGAKVKVTKTGENAYLISVPEFIFIGYHKPTFKVAVEDGGLLSWATPDIDKLEMVNEILNDRAAAEVPRLQREAPESADQGLLQQPDQERRPGRRHEVRVQFLGQRRAVLASRV